MLTPAPRVDPSGDGGVRELTLRSLFESEETPLLRYAFSLVKRREVAEEIVQEVFLQLHLRWKDVESPRAWLFRSVRNRVFNHLRNHRREVMPGDDVPVADESDEDVSPGAVLERMEATVALRKILAELNETDRQLVTLKYFEGMKYREISEQTGLSVGNVGYRLHHILKSIADQLRPLGIDDIT